MGTDIYTSVSITDAPSGWLETLPDFDLSESSGWELGRDYDPELGKHAEVETSYYLYGVAWYSDIEKISKWIGEFTTEHPLLSVVLSQEWDADGHGEEVMVYRAGELVRPESRMNGMVPIDITLILDQATKLLDEYDEGHPVDSEGAAAEVYAAGPIVEAFRALIEGLRQ